MVKADSPAAEVQKKPASLARTTLGSQRLACYGSPLWHPEEHPGVL